ncbi:MAG: hypothetical protein ABI670_03995 [Chloroflexota bacterium]
MDKPKKVCTGTFLVCLVMLAAAFGRPGDIIANAQIAPTGSDWQQIADVPADIDFHKVFMADNSLGIAVGEQGDKGVAFDLQWNMQDSLHNWLELTPVRFDFRAPLWAAVRLNEDMWAVGEQGLIVHGHNALWSETASPVQDAHLLTLQMLGNGEEGWAGGYRSAAIAGEREPVLLHYKDGKWQRDDSITGAGTINSIHFTQGGGWAVGEAGIWHYRNGQWSKEQAPNPCPETGCFPAYSEVRAINSDEAWIAGSRMGLCGICVPNPYILHREGGNWQIVVDTRVHGDPTREGTGRELYGLTFTDSGAGLPLLGWAVGTIRTNDGLMPYILSHNSNQAPGEWQYVPYPAGTQTQLTSVSAPDKDHVIAVGTAGTILTFGYGPQPPPPLTPGTTPTIVTGPTPTATITNGMNPTQRIPDPHNANLTYFEAVGHTLGGGFRDYWQQHGGLAQFGYPLTEEFTEVSPTDGKPYVTQYFERARFEYHPENKPPFDVLLGLLGRTITAGRESEGPFQRAAAQTGAGTLYFDATGHNMPPQFSVYWQQHGGLSVYGYPISEPFIEVSPTDGRPYLVQYFERNRLEYHPELPGQFQVSLALLGVQVLQQRGWISGLSAR